MRNQWSGFSPNELRVIKSLRTPQKIQDFLDTKLRYNKEVPRETCRSPKYVLKTKEAHCIEGALFAAACLRYHGFKPLIVDFAAKRDHDHVICVFKQNGLWGAISMSRFHTLQWRDPVFRTLRELALSYFCFYNNQQGSKTLDSYSRPVSLTRFDKEDWMTSSEDLWNIGNYLFTVKHYSLVPISQRKLLRSLSKHFMKADKMQK